VTVTNTLTTNEHTDRVLSNCAQSVFALKTLRAHGLNRECLRNVFNAVILAKRTYGASAWIGFTRASDRERTEAFIRRCLRSELCSVNTKPFRRNVRYLRQPDFQQYHTYSASLSSTNYFRQSPQLRKTTILEYANTGCSHSHAQCTTHLLIVILFIELFILTFINCLRNSMLILLCCGLSTFYLINYNVQ